MTSAYDDFRNLIRDEQDKRIATYIKQGHSKKALCLLFAIPSSRITEAIAAVEEKQTKEVHANNGNKKADINELKPWQSKTLVVFSWLFYAWVITSVVLFYPTIFFILSFTRMEMEKQKSFILLYLFVSTSLAYLFWALSDKKFYQRLHQLPKNLHQLPKNLYKRLKRVDWTLLVEKIIAVFINAPLHGFIYLLFVGTPLLLLLILLGLLLNPLIDSPSDSPSYRLSSFVLYAVFGSPFFLIFIYGCRQGFLNFKLGDNRPSRIPKQESKKTPGHLRWSFNLKRPWSKNKKSKASKPDRVSSGYKYGEEFTGHGTNPLFVKKPRMLRNQYGVLRPESEDESLVFYCFTGCFIGFFYSVPFTLISFGAYAVFGGIQYFGFGPIVQALFGVLATLSFCYGFSTFYSSRSNRLAAGKAYTYGSVNSAKKEVMRRDKSGVLRPESEVLAGGNKKQEPLSNNNQSKVALSLMFGALIMGAIFLIPWHWIGKGISSTAEVLGDLKMPSIALTSNANQSGLNRNVESWERFVNSLKEKASRELRRLNKEFDGGSVFRVRYINDDVQRTKSLRNPIVGELTFVIEQDQLALLAIQQKAEDLRKLNDRLRQSKNRAEYESAQRQQSINMMVDIANGRATIPPIGVPMKPKESTPKVEETHTEYREYTEFKLTYARKGDSWEFLNGHSTKLLDPSEKEQGKTESFGIGNTPTTLGLSSFINN